MNARSLLSNQRVNYSFYVKRGWAIFFRVNRDLIFFFSSDSPFTMINLCKNVALAAFNIGGLFFCFAFSTRLSIIIAKRYSAKRNPTR